MSTSRSALRWIAPLVGLALALAALGAGTLLRADAAVSLPPRSAKQLLVDLQTARPAAFSGTVVQQANLGLPQLPSIATGEGSSDLSSLVSGNHTLKVWYDGPQRVRLALLGTLGESDVIRNGRDLWIWSSQTKTATHRILPAHTKGTRPDAGPPADGPDPGQLPTTPQEAADLALAALDPTTKVTTDGTARVAGRDVYQLILSPRGQSSLVRDVRLAIDAKTHLPLQVQAYARDLAEPAFQVSFTKIDYARPSTDQFAFTPPPGTRVERVRPGHLDAPDQRTREDSGSDDTSRHPSATAPEPRVVGTGWTAVGIVALPVAEGADGATRSGRAQAGELGMILRALPKVHGPWGSGRLLRGSLFSVLVTDDGRVLVGAVRPDRLFAVAGAAR